ncbi:MAG TPA: TetR/AcrR family transcriptional regulator [Thermomonospora sp.]|nr:TetR/AcrR family transcriptional regulator [Thermomonospora sp.]
MSGTASSESGARGRTRRAILSAAARVLARDRTATLADIAEEADVGRSTLHRYFSDRQELIEAAVEDAFGRIEQAVRDAAPDQGPPLEAMRRLVAAHVDVGEQLVFLFGDPQMLETHTKEGLRDRPSAAENTMVDLIRRGQAEGVFDPEVDVEWIQQVLWALVYTGLEAAAQGLLPRHGVTATVIRTFENGIHTRGRDAS